MPLMNNSVLPNCWIMLFWLRNPASMPYIHPIISSPGIITKAKAVFLLRGSEQPCRLHPYLLEWFVHRVSAIIQQWSHRLSPPWENFSQVVFGQPWEAEKPSMKILPVNPGHLKLPATNACSSAITALKSFFGEKR